MLNGLKKKFLFLSFLVIGAVFVPDLSKAAWTCSTWTCKQGYVSCSSATIYFCSGQNKCSQTNYYYCKNKVRCGTCTYGPSCTSCGSGYWENSYQCSGNTVERLYRYKGCSGQGSCYNYTGWVDYTNCGSGYWENSYQCSGNTIQRLYRYKGCSGGSCYNYTGWSSWQTCSSGYTCSGSSCVDAVPPVFTSFYVSPDDWTNTNPTWRWAAVDAGSGMRSSNRYYIFLNGNGQGYTNNISYAPNLSTGTHRVFVNAYDNADNAVGSGNVYAYVDKTNPSASLSVNKTSVSPGETIILTITASDSHSGVKNVQAYYQGSWHAQSCNSAASCTRTWSFSESSDGDYTYTGYAYDMVDNGGYADPSTVSVHVKDNTPPTVSISGAPSQWQASSATAIASCADSASGCKAGKTCLAIMSSDPGSCASLSSGYYDYCAPTLVTYHRWVCARAEDQEGNIGYSSVVEFKIDPLEPFTPTINSPAANSTQAQNFSVSVSGDADNDSGIDKCYYHVEDSAAGWTKSWAERPCNGSFTVTVGLGKDCRASNGTCAVYVFSRDKAGNDSDYRSRNFNISLCDGSAILALNKSVVLQGENVIYTVSGLSNCAGREVQIREETTGHLLVGGCDIAAEGTGCQTTIPAPSLGGLWEATYKYYAQIDKNRDNDLDDSGEKSSLKPLQVLNTLVACVSNNCSYFVATSYSYASDTNWLGLFGLAFKGSGGSLISQCNSGSSACQLNGYYNSGTNGQSCHLVDACNGTAQALGSIKSGKWDVEEGCIICSNSLQLIKIASADQQCFNYQCSGSSASWQQLSCAVSSGNNKCEFACGADADCDEKTVGAVWMQGNKQYKCDSSCEKILVDNSPPVTIIKETNPLGTNPWFKQSFSVRIEDTDDQGLKNCWFSLYACDIGGLNNCAPKKTNTLRTCNAWLGISSTDCNREGRNTCKLEAWAVDTSDNQGNKDTGWYSMDFSPPLITH